MNDWEIIPQDDIIAKTIEALQANQIDAKVVATAEQAKTAALEIIPTGAEVMTMTSDTLDTIGISAAINESGKYDSVKEKLALLDRATQGSEMQKLGSAPAYAIGSVHVITEDGTVIIASNSGSQLPAYAYGAEHVIWIVGAQKIVKNLDAGFNRLYEHTLPLESKRVQKAYGMPYSFVSKVLVVNRESKAGRITVILVKEVLGY